MEETVLKKAEKYWTRRAAGYSKVNQEELNGSQRMKWLRKLDGRIRQQYPDQNRADIRILDVGTGPGFFAVILAEAGYDVTAVDYTPAMLDQAKANAGALADRIRFLRMDGQDLEFPDNTFDVVISRNLTWGLEHPKRAYASWKRVLKPGGLLLNFDANYGRSVDKNAADTDKNRPYGHNGITKELEEENSYITKAMKINYKDRPNWDLNVLNKIGFKQCLADTGVGKRILMERDIKESPLFKITARKGVC